MSTADEQMTAQYEAHGPVEELEIDEEFELHQAAVGRQYAKHLVTGMEVLEVHGHAPRYFDNAAEGHRAPLVMVGPTGVGRMITVPIESAGRYGLYRPVSAFESNAKDIERYREEASDE